MIENVNFFYDRSRIVPIDLIKLLGIAHLTIV